MAHSRVFEVSTERISKTERMSSISFIDNGFVGTVADCVIDVENDEREDSVKWLMGMTREVFEFLQESDTYKIRLLPNGKKTSSLKVLTQI